MQTLVQKMEIKFQDQVLEMQSLMQSMGQQGLLVQDFGNEVSDLQRQLAQDVTPFVPQNQSYPPYRLLYQNHASKPQPTSYDGVPYVPPSDNKVMVPQNYLAHEQRRHVPSYQSIGKGASPQTPTMQEEPISSGHHCHEGHPNVRLHSQMQGEVSYVIHEVEVSDEHIIEGGDDLATLICQQQEEMAYQVSLPQQEEERDKCVKEFEEEARLKIAQMQEVGTEEPPKRRFASFRASSPIQVPIPNRPPFPKLDIVFPSTPRWKEWTPISPSMDFTGSITSIEPCIDKLQPMQEVA